MSQQFAIQNPVQFQQQQQGFVAQKDIQSFQNYVPMVVTGDVASQNNYMISMGGNNMPVVTIHGQQGLPPQGADGVQQQQQTTLVVNNTNEKGVQGNQAIGAGIGADGAKTDSPNSAIQNMQMQQIQQLQMMQQSGNTN